ncbi:MAG: hypothetical protein WC773_00115 [Patescibacteria group bacterium]|jgi:hypothetical protein
MLSTPHILTGSAIGKIAAPLGLPAVFALGFISHFVLDLIPHTDAALLESSTEDHTSTHDLLVVIAEVVVGTGLFLYFWYISHWNLSLLVGAFGATLPDLFDNAPWWKKWFRTSKLGSIFHYLHELVDGGLEKNKLLGIATQFLVIAVAIIVLT